MEEGKKEKGREEVEQKVKEVDEAMAKAAAPKVTIVRELQAELSPTSMSPESSDDEAEKQPKHEIPRDPSGGGHMDEVNAMFADMESPKSSEEADDDYGSDFDD